MIRDQLISNAYLTAVRDKLLLEDDLTLERALAIACQVEAAVKNATLLSSAKTVPTAPVQAVGASRGCFRGERGARAAPEREKKRNGNQQQRKCFRCGSNKHLANDKKCPAASVNCNKCGKKGHFAKVCNSAASEIREVVVPELAILQVKDAKFTAATYDKIACNVHIEAPKENFHVLELIVDPGASVSILPETMYRQYFVDCSLTEPQVKLVTYAKREVPVIGCLPATAAIAGQDSRVPASFHIVKAGSPLLGLDLIKALNVNIIGGKVNFTTEADPNTAANKT